MAIRKQSKHARFSVASDRLYSPKLELITRYRLTNYIHNEYALHNFKIIQRAKQMQSREGQKVPSVTFRTRQNNQWVDISTDDLFAGKTVIVFSLPGAFTPTCSSTHLPGYNELASVFKENGVDEIVCVSVNDTFVMNEWAKEQRANNITVIPDGNGEFTEGMGMLVDKADLGFGKRSWRYSMLVKDGVIDKMSTLR